jgi:hypothetical protein
MLIDLDYEIIDFARKTRDGRVRSQFEFSWLVDAVAEAADNTVIHDGTFGPPIDAPYYDDEYAYNPGTGYHLLTGPVNYGPTRTYRWGDPS